MTRSQQFLLSAVAVASLGAAPVHAADGDRGGKLARPGQRLRDIVTAHQRGQDVRPQLSRALSAMLPHGWVSTKSRSGKPLMVQIESAADAQRGWLSARVYDPATLKGNCITGRRYRTQARFDLVPTIAKFEKTRFVDFVPYPHSKIDKLSFDGRTLVVRQRRDKSGRGYDRGARYQELRLGFGSDNTLQTVSVREFAHPVLAAFGQSLSASMPKRIVAHDFVAAAGESPLIEFQR